MHKLPLAGLFLSFVVVLSSNADTEFEDSIPIDVAEILFTSSLSSPIKIYSDINSEFPAFIVPDDFFVVGSVIDNYTVRAVLSTSLSREQGTQLLTAAFQRESWQEFPAMRPPVAESGFVTPTPAADAFSFTLCHDQQGRLSISSIELESVNYFSLGRFSSFGNTQGSCARQLQQQEQAMSQMRFSGGIRQYMPRMEVPATENVSPYRPFFGGGTSSGNNSAETDINLETELSIEELYTHFSEQIIEQDWEIDSEAVGGRSATGTWTKSPESGLELVGTLSVLETSEGNYELRFRLRADGEPESGSVGVFLRSTN